jgi:type IV pilus assembly protein PilE
MRLSREPGFTLIELLIVMIILAILTAVAVPSYRNFRDRANNAAAGANVRMIVPSIESYYANSGTYTGMTITSLKASYDQAIRTTLYRVSGLTRTSYCISSTVNSKTYRKVGPSGRIVSGAAC